MDKKEVMEALNMMQKAIQEKQPSENITNILKRLQDNVVATEELLRVGFPSFDSLSCRVASSATPSDWQMKLW